MAEDDAYTKSTAELDLERRIEEDFESPNKVDWGTVPDQVSEDGYVNTDPIYQNAATPGGEPYWSEEGAMKTLEERVLGDQMPGSEDDESDEDDTEEDEHDDEGTEESSPTPPTQSFTPPVNQ
jgi:hypothetical protein